MGAKNSVRQRIPRQPHYDDEGYVVGPPELIDETASSSASYDFGEQPDVYEAAGVLEYLVLKTIEGRVITGSTSRPVYPA